MLATKPLEAFLISLATHNRRLLSCTGIQSSWAASSPRDLFPFHTAFKDGGEKDDGEKELQSRTTVHNIIIIILPQGCQRRGKGSLSLRDKGPVLGQSPSILFCWASFFVGPPSRYLRGTLTFCLITLLSCRQVPDQGSGVLEGVQASLIPPYYVQLTWQNPDPHPWRFQIYRSEGENPPDRILAEVYVPFYYDGSVTLDALYTYQVIALSPGIPKRSSPFVKVRTPPSPLTRSPLRETYLTRHPPPFTNSSEAHFEFVAIPPLSGEIFRCQVDETQWFYCIPPLHLTELKEGEHRFAVAYQDPEGTSDPTPFEFRWVVDQTPPLLNWIVPPPPLIYGDTITLTFLSSEPAFFSCWINELPFYPCTQPFVLSGLSYGEYRMEISGLDRAGNLSLLPLTATIWVARDPPETRLTFTPSPILSTLPVTIAFTGVHPRGISGFVCDLQGNRRSCASPYEVTGLVPGSYLFSVSALGPDGEPDPTPERFTFQYAPLAGETRALWHSPRFTPLPQQAVEFLPPQGGEIGCSLDGEPWHLCPSRNTFTFTSGTHTFIAAVQFQGVSDPTPFTFTFTVVPPDLVALDLFVGYEHACFIHPGGSLYCLGNNSYGQLGTGDLFDSSIPVEVSHPEGRKFLKGCAGKLHSCAIDETLALYCFGSNAYGQLGRSDPQPVSTPTRISGITGITDVSCGGFHTCVRTTSGEVFCTGLNSYGNLGDGTTTTRFGFVPVTLPEPSEGIGAGKFHTCSLSSSGRGWCWGWNGWGQLGDHTRTDRLTPVEVSGALRWRSFSLGDTHTCGITESDELYCFGDNRSGAVNGQENAPSFVSDPVLFPFSLPVSAITAGEEHTCFITRDRFLYCFGKNTRGQLGILLNTGYPQPVSTAWEAPWERIQGKGSWNCGLRSSSLPFCFGTAGGGLFSSSIPTYMALNPPGR